jgi:hypothetical protein
MRTFITSAALATALWAAPGAAQAQINSGYNGAPYCLVNPDGSGNCSYQSMNECLRSRANVSANMRCLPNRASGADRAWRRVEQPSTTGLGTRRY